MPCVNCVCESQQLGRSSAMNKCRQFTPVTMLERQKGQRFIMGDPVSRLAGLFIALIRRTRVAAATKTQHENGVLKSMKRWCAEYLCCVAIGEYMRMKIFQSLLFDAGIIHVKSLSPTYESYTFLQKREPGVLRSAVQKGCSAVSRDYP